MLLLPSDLPEIWGQQTVEKNANNTAMCVKRRQYICWKKGILLPQWWGCHHGSQQRPWDVVGALSYKGNAGFRFMWKSVYLGLCAKPGPQEGKTANICSWRLNTNSAWGEPQFAQIVQFLKLCFFQYATILAAACLGTLHTQHRDILFYSSAWAVPLCVCCQWPFPPIYMVATRRGDSWHISAMTYQPPHLHLGPGSLSSPHKHFMLRVMKASRWLKAY